MKLTKTTAATFCVMLLTNTALANEDVTCVQIHLEEQGLDAGGIDGLYGKKSRLAADRFQSMNPIASALPAFTRQTAKLWCNTLRPEISLRDGYWIAKFAGSCAALTIEDGAASYQAGSCARDGSVAFARYKAPNERVGSDVIIGKRQIKVEAARCSAGYMVTKDSVQCDWTLNEYRRDGLVFSRLRQSPLP